jgi:hypothetical protein
LAGRSPRKWALDQRVTDLCAKDGGIKVYEALVLPKERFNEFGFVNFYRPTQAANALGPEYVFKAEVHYYQQGSPEMRRHHYQVIRKSDGKLLGESISYHRRGGDVLPLPIHDSSYGCPEGVGDTTLLKQLFLRGA